jgi:hypothetical protein
VAPPIASVPAGDTVQFTATGHYSDLSTQDVTQTATWASSSSAVAVSNSTHSHGLATGETVGSAVVTATDPTSLAQGAASVTVTPAVLSSVSVSPVAAALAQGQSQPFMATGHYSDQSTKDMTTTATWSSSSTSVATVSNSVGSQGLATAVAAGVAQITAKDSVSGLQGTAQVTVGQVPLLVLTPASGPAGAAVQAKGFNFHARSGISVYYLDGTRLRRICHGRVATDGTLQCSGTIPAAAHAGAKGQHEVVAKGWRRHQVATTFTLTG